jgi:hypothetical protein
VANRPERQRSREGVFACREHPGRGGPSCRCDGRVGRRFNGEDWPGSDIDKIQSLNKYFIRCDRMLSQLQIMLGFLAMPSDLRSSPSSLPLPSLQPIGLDDSVSPRLWGITRLTVDVPSANVPSSIQAAKRPPARWWTAEFILYYLVACVVIPWMVWVPVSLSSCSCSPCIIFLLRVHVHVVLLIKQLHIPTMWSSGRGYLQVGYSVAISYVLTFDQFRTLS